MHTVLLVTISTAFFAGIHWMAKRIERRLPAGKLRDILTADGRAPGYKGWLVVLLPFVAFALFVLIVLHSMPH